MKFVKIFIIVFFIVSVTVFGSSLVKQFLSYDSTKPVIVSEAKEIEVPCDYTREEIMQGLSAYDETDGDITDKIKVGNTSRFIEKGICDVTYTVFDSSNQSASLTRRVKFTDYQSPSFKLSSPLVFEEETMGSLKILDYFSAYDMLDKEIQKGILQTESTVNYSTQGDYEITVEVSNSKGDTSTLTLPVHILDQGSVDCEIILSEYLVYLNIGDTFDPVSFLVNVIDQDGNILDSSGLSISSNVDTNKAGVYEVCFDPTPLGCSGPMYMNVVVR